MDLLIGPYTVRVYTEQLVAQTDLTDAELGRLFDRLEKLEGDYDLRTALSAVLAEERVSDQSLPRVVAIAERIHGAYDRRVLLEVIAQRPLTPSAFDLYRKIAAGIEGDYDLRMAIVAALANPSVDADGVAQLLDLAAQSVQGDYDLSQVVQSVPQLHESGAATAAAIRTLPAISGSYDRRVSLAKMSRLHYRDRFRW